MNEEDIKEAVKELLDKGVGEDKRAVSKCKIRK